MRRILLTFNFIALLVLAAIQQSGAQQKNLGKAIPSRGSDKQLPLSPEVRTGKLQNGFTYYIQHNAQPEKRVLMYLVNKVGSLQEDDDQRGLAHFTEHMSFNGTRHFPKNKLVDYLQRSGVTFGADLNAYTSFEETVYQLPMPSDNPELLSTGIQIMRDWAQEATLDESEINKERGVVLEEKRLGKGAEERLQRTYWPKLLENSRYATRIPIGIDQVLNNFGKPELLRFYKDWYRPDLQALVIVGDINVDEIEKTVLRKFNDLKNPVKARPRKRYTVPVNGENHFIALTDPEMTGTVVQFAIRHQQKGLKTEANLLETIRKQLFNQMIGTRYAELSRHGSTSYVSGAGGISGFIGGTESYAVTIQTRPGLIEKGFKDIWRETLRLKHFGFTTAELQRAKSEYLSQVGAIYKERNKLPSAAFAKQYQDHFLNGTASPGLAFEYKFISREMPHITLAQVNQLAKDYIRDNNQDLLIEAPTKEKDSLPTQKVFERWLVEANAEVLAPYKDDAVLGSLLAALPVPGKITSKTVNKSAGLVNLMLSNGVKVILKPTTFKNDEVIFNSFSPGGTSLYSDKDFQSASNAAQMIAAGGVGNFNISQLSKFLGDKRAAVSPFIGERSQGISGISSPKDLEVALQLAYAYYTSPRMDSVIFKSIIDRTRSVLADRANAPTNVFADTVNAVLSNHNPRRTSPSLEKLNQINLKESYRIYKESFSRLGDLTFTFVGNIDTAAIRPLLEKYLGSLPGTMVSQPAKELVNSIPSGRIFKTVRKGQEPQASVQLYWSGKYSYGAKENLAVDALKECLQIRLIERLREDESGVYSPRVFAGISKIPKSLYTFNVSFGCAPQNADKLIFSVNDEIKRLIDQGPLQLNIDKWRAELLRQHETAIQTNSWWIGYLNDQLLNQTPIDSYLQFVRIVNEIGREDIQNAAAKYLSGANYIQFQLVPEK